MRILWPNMPKGFEEIARGAAGQGVEVDFHADPATVSEAQWRAADAVVGAWGDTSRLDEALDDLAVFLGATR